MKVDSESLINLNFESNILHIDDTRFQSWCLDKWQKALQKQP